MHVEIKSAADFLVQLVRLQQQNKKISGAQLSLFKGSLCDLLVKRYREHWFPEHPNRGSAYRCIRINGKMDPIIAQAGAAIGIPPTSLRNFFPYELTLWIDPQEVSYRIGENGSICVLYESQTIDQKIPPPRQSPELYLDPRQFEVDPLVDYVGVNC